MPTHGVAVPRGQDAEPGRGPIQGRFGRMFAPRQAFDDSDAAIAELVRLMRARAPASEQRENVDIPAGFTYLGQFIDHDITFDPTSKRDRRNDPHALVNFRTPRYDLDSVYGAGPTAQPYLYDRVDPTRLLVVRVAEDGPDDLPRNPQGRALIGDARNDENVIVGQLHLLFVKFHNAVVQRLAEEVDEGELLEEAQRVVRWHYQWIVVHDFLPRVVGRELAARALARREHFLPEDEPFIPVEFSGAAYRFGHSLVRNQYGIKRLPDDPQAAPKPKAKNLFPQLAGGTWLAPELVIDWERFFPLPGLEGQVQPSFKIDTALARALFDLPEGGGELPRLNLERGRALGLPSGQEVAAAMDEPALPEEALLLDDQVPHDVRQALLAATPLWYYVLCEAAHTASGKHLGPVGGGIVAEVLVGLLADDPSSFLSQEPTWLPRELGTGGRFSMADLVRIAQG